MVSRRGKDVMGFDTVNRENMGSGSKKRCLVPLFTARLLFTFLLVVVVVVLFIVEEQVVALAPFVEEAVEITLAQA
ncbi:hypothetical protein KSC_063800 [Ktedonobacter sp. SOSP1-52]|nr:hypothetical protein KSC_063800 [Ktedonobacter sp. SOSP1-52]